LKEIEKARRCGLPIKPLNHRVFRKYNDSHHLACVRESRLASNAVKKAKLSFEKKLAEIIKKDSKSFLLMFVGDPR